MAAKKAGKKRGRKSVYYTSIQPRLKEIEGWVKEGLLHKEIYTRLGISYQTFYRFLNEFSEFNDVINNTPRDHLVDDLEKTAYKVAQGYYVEEEKTVIGLDENGKPTKRSKEIYKKWMQPNSRILEFLLVNWAKDKYKRDPAQMDFKEQELQFKKDLADKEDGWLDFSEEELPEGKE